MATSAPAQFSDQGLSMAFDEAQDGEDPCLEPPTGWVGERR
jgi:hypothetical protein